ncbi:hypothetical protein [Bacillus toyonensis]|uniref:hypothetical protein n=1 Tax=Bacillus toyonensis TaxID=155322 RepID=UPI000BF4C77C|nr:hypothetical protein [Bacillus toyonensis]PGA41625.1 hypothetical protein COL85_25690 [Bacillus toyonensis]
MNLTNFKKDYKINFLFWGIPMFILMNFMYYKETIKYIQNKEWINLTLDISVSLLIALLATILYTILCPAITNFINNKFSKNK